MREQTEGPTDAQVSRTCGAFTRSGVVCDREPGHVGDHRGYVEEVDEAVFWPQSASMDMIQATLESALAAAQAEGENLKARIYFLEQANSILARQRDEAEADLAAAREEVERKDAIIQRLGQELADAHGIIRRLHSLSELYTDPVEGT